MTPPRASKPKADSDLTLPVYFYAGTDDLAASKAAADRLDQLCPPEDRDFNLEIIEPETPSPSADESSTLLSRAIGALLTPSLLGGPKTVYLRNAPFFDPLADPGRFADVKLLLEKLLDLFKKGLPPGVTLLVLAPKLNKTTAFAKYLLAHASVHVFDRPEYASQAKATFDPALDDLLAAHSLSFDRASTRAAFVDRIGYDTRLAASELEKLALYLDSRRTVTLDDVQLMVAPTRDAKPWDFADAVCAADLPLAIRTARRLILHKVYPVLLVIALEDAFRSMAVFRDALDRRWCTLSGSSDWPKLLWNPLPPEADALLASLSPDPRKIGFKAAKTAQLSKRFPASRWIRFLFAAIDLHADMTGGSAADPALQLELFLLRTLGPFSPRPAAP